MEFDLKQWRNQEESEAKVPRLVLDLHSTTTPTPSGGGCGGGGGGSSSSALPLFVSEPPTSKVSASTSSDSATTKFPRMGGSYFSLGQWQELELQALIFRHIIAGAPVPPELLHLVKKSLFNSAPPYYFPHPLQHYPAHYHPAAPLMQAGYWGRAAMDPEPGRCRRTDGKKWRCSRDVVAGQKYCERHMHRGRNRSRKPVEIPTPTPPSYSGGPKSAATTTADAQPLSALAGRDGGAPIFTLSAPSPSIDLFQLNQRHAEAIIENNDGQSGGQTLRHFFDDWPTSLHENESGGATASSVASATNLSISIPGNPSSDFSLKLSTGDGCNNNTGRQIGNIERTTWGTANQVGSMGGPLAEALRSSTSNSSPTSVLHQLQRASTSDVSFISS